MYISQFWSYLHDHEWNQNIEVEEEIEIELEKDVDLTDIFDFSGEEDEEEKELIEAITPESEIPEVIEEEIQTYEEPEIQVIPRPVVKAGTLDIVRVPYNRSQTEPDLDALRMGGSISEWLWLEPEQIQLIRQQVLVLSDPSTIDK